MIYKYWSAEKEGERARLKFTEQRLGKDNEHTKSKEGEGIFFDRIKKMKLKDISSGNLTKSRGRSNIGRILENMSLFI